MAEQIPPRHRSRADFQAQHESAESKSTAEPLPPAHAHEDEYSIGYKKPPKDHQFRPGQSGNPRGRPKESRNLKTELEEELQELVRVIESGTRRTVTKQRAVLKSLTARAVQGDTKAANLVLNLVLRLLGQDGGEEDADDLTDEDLAILETFKNKRHRRNLRKRTEIES